MRGSRRALGLAAAAALLVAGAGVQSACGSASATETPPPTLRAPVLVAATGSTFTVSASWTPLVWHGDTITTFRRTVTRTDAGQDLGVYGFDINAALDRLDSDQITLPLPNPGPSASYRYCLRSTVAGVVSSDSACGTWTYTSADTVPPAPSGLQVSPDTGGATIAWLDGSTGHLVLDSLSIAFAGHDSLDTDSTHNVPPGTTRLALAVWWMGTHPIACFAKTLAVASDCALVGVVRDPTVIRNGQALYFAGWDSATGKATFVPKANQLSLAMATVPKATALVAAAAGDRALPWRSNYLGTLVAVYGRPTLP